ncbi:hypothetical protein OsI_38672 [Oryza sativa Indica Group]|uniref:Uncharacterized protein n=1 Tax=Oryza sativa subsp. indica TaxID=39946 RepID=A2ZLH7_ORYSI|nr:hypothetical protein OsI_38672 [Oryza sativa Indica Group]
MRKARVCVRAPHGAGALLVVGGAVVGAAVFAWCRRRGEGERKRGAKNHGEHPAKEEEGLDGGVVEGEQVNEAVETYDHNSERDCTEITAHAMDTENVTEDDDNSVKNSVENEITDTEGEENSVDSTLSLSSPDITLEEHENHNCVVQDTASREITLSTGSVMHQEQFSEEANNEETAEVKLVTRNSDYTNEETETIPMAETAEVKLAEEKARKKNEFEQEEENSKEESVKPYNSLAYSSVPSLLKRTVKKGQVNPRWNETGMKLEQDCTNGELNEHELTKGGAAAMGGAVLTMARRPDSMAILALIVAVTIAITIVVRLYVPLQAT